MNAALPKILIVDDKPANLVVLEKLLANSNVEVVRANSGNEALAHCLRQEFALVLLDVNMPEMDGYEVAQWLRQEERTRHISILFITAIETDVQQAIRGYGTGAVDFIQKPIDNRILISKVNVFLELYTRRRSQEELVKHLGVQKAQLEQEVAERIRMENILLAMLDTLIVLSPAGVVERVSRPELIGYTEEALVGQSIDTLFSFPDDDRISHRIRSGPIHATETLLTSTDGRKISVLISGSPMQDDEESISHALLVIKEITQYKEAQRALQEKDAQLLAAEMASQTKGAFLATMSHEIRTPMNAVIGLTDLALRTEVTPKTRDYLTKIEQASRSLMRILNDILDFSKIDAGRMTLECEDFQLESVFEHMADLFRSKTAEKGIELTMGVANTCPDGLRGDALRLEQILTNLIDNAIKFTEKGIIDCRVKTLKETTDQITLTFSVRDSGIGLTEEQRNILFDPFVQADGSTTRKYGGTGLGLSICKRLVEQMDGKIWVESIPGQGSTFYFFAVFGRQIKEDTSSPALPESLRGTKVLAVDNNVFAREIFYETLQSFDLDPSLAVSGKDALELIRTAMAEKHPFQLILLDYRMPGMDGIETAQRIREIAAQDASGEPPPHIILLTAFGAEDGLERLAKDAGVDAFLGKPVNRYLLFDTIMELFGVVGPKYHRPTQRGRDTTEIIAKVGGARILLVEDTPINQQVVCELLEGVRMHVDIANNGSEAVRMVDKGDYDAVLMDIQMPVMDGYDATRAIRENPRFKQLPIIAMTAHAMAEDREKCLAAGMDDHIAKPIDTEKLFAVLTTRIKPADRLTPQTENTCTTTKEPPFPEELPGVDVKSALFRLMGNKTLLARLWAQFNRDYGTAIQVVQDAFAQGNAEEARQMVHKIKGVSGNIGLSHVYEAACNLDLAVKQARETDWPDLTKLFAKAMQEAQTVIMELQHKGLVPSPPGREEKTEEPQGDKGALPDLTFLKPAMAELTTYLSQNNLAATIAFNTVKPALLKAGFRKEVGEVRDRIDRLDYQNALPPLMAIIRTLGL